MLKHPLQPVSTSSNTPLSYSLQVDSVSYNLNFTNNGKNSIPEYIATSDQSVSNHILYVKTEFLTTIQTSYESLKPAPEPEPDQS